MSVASEDTRERVARAIWEHRRATSELVAVWLPWDGITDDSERNDVLAEAEAVLAVVSPSPVDAEKEPFKAGDRVRFGEQEGTVRVAYNDGTVLIDWSCWPQPFFRGPYQPEAIEHAAAAPPVGAERDIAIRVWIDRQHYDFKKRLTTGAKLCKAAAISDDMVLWREGRAPTEEDVEVPEDQGFALFRDDRFYSSPKGISSGAAAPPVGVDEGQRAPLKALVEWLNHGVDLSDAHTLDAAESDELVAVTRAAWVWRSGLSCVAVAERALEAAASSAAPGVTEAQQRRAEIAETCERSDAAEDLREALREAEGELRRVAAVVDEETDAPLLLATADRAAAALAVSPAPPDSTAFTTAFEFAEDEAGDGEPIILGRERGDEGTWTAGASIPDTMRRLADKIERDAGSPAPGEEEQR